ncbi:chemotaxis protein CheX [Desulfonatronum thiosulfatophilum]|uniref:Chemotaxis protein CheX n=1 Tax=Desulfonatronum thiosulfatophilum TaxID=617002 RepID=A0A1G6EGT3_9BACT|nr:chemotaxis protein CheX [Desulfonatronum thiosulfatophilum]SDB56687.1 chemotaxis protein CheX [Desulfonatronum thiosulfatophilum]
MVLRYDVSFINPFLDAVVGVLGMMASVKVNPGKPYINRSRSAIGDVTGSLGFSGSADGVMSLTLDEPVILKIVNNMLAESYSTINDDIADAVGELTNMIAGQARQDLVKQGMKLKASTPTVIIGKGHKISHITSSPILAIPFTTDEGSLVVEVSFEPEDSDNP